MRSSVKDWPRRFWGAIFTAAVLLTAVEARGVIIYSSGTYATRNTSPPTAAQGLDGWSYEFQWGGFLATPIDAIHFLGAKHVGLQASSINFTYQGNTQTLPVDGASQVDDPGSDLSMFTLQAGYTFPTWAPLYRASVDGSETNKTLTVIGRGTQPGDPIYQNSVKKGWYWGAGDGVQSWGQNQVSGFTGYNGVSSTSLLYFKFDGPGIANEGVLSVGDSSGAVYIQANGQWKLAGINYAVDGPFSLNSSGSPSFMGAIYDYRGLYYPNGSIWSLASGPSALPVASYASRISDRLQWIESLIFSGDANLDGTIDINDLNAVLTNYNKTGMTWAKGDFDANQTVDLADLAKVLSNYNRTLGANAGGAGVSAVPEPSALMLLGVAAIGLFSLVRHRR